MNHRESYDIEWLKGLYSSEERLKYLFFWGHKPSLDGTITSSCLSQWYLCQFVRDGNKFNSTQQWMMYQKAILFNDDETSLKILESSSPGEAKALGRVVSNFDEEVWNKHRSPIVIEGNVLKFSQNPPLKEFLLNTKERVLVEASPLDEIWGVGLSKESESINDPNAWRGLNLLGFALMEVRDILKE